MAASRSATAVRRHGSAWCDPATVNVSRRDDLGDCTGEQRGRLLDPAALALARSGVPTGPAPCVSSGPQARDQVAWQPVGVVKVVEVLLGEPASEPGAGEHLPTALHEAIEPLLLVMHHMAYAGR